MSSGLWSSTSLKPPVNWPCNGGIINGGEMGGGGVLLEGGGVVLVGGSTGG